MLRTGKSAAPPAPTVGGSPPAAPLVERVVGWSARHRALAIASWFALVAVAVMAAALIPGPGAGGVDPGESGRAERVLDAQHGYVPVLENVLIQSRTGARFTGDADLRQATRDLEAALQRTPGTVTDLRSPLRPGGDTLVSGDERSGLVTFQLAGSYDQVGAQYDTVVRAVAEVAARHPRARVVQAGDKSLTSAVDAGIKGDFKRAEYFSLPLTVVILLFVFGSLVAVGIPLLLALTTVIGAFGLLQVIDHWVPINSATHSMVLLIGVAVGIDYSLFYLRREREERAAGRTVEEALRITARTSGRVVLVSGLTVALCMTGLLLSGLAQLRGLTIGAVLVVGLAVVGSVTVLPALLSLLGRWVDRGRIPWLGRRRTKAAESRAWTAIARAVVRRPLLWGGAAVLALVVLALPVSGIRLQDAAATDSLPRSVPVVDAAIRMQDAFPGTPSPARVVLWESRAGALDAPGVRRAIDGLRGQAGSGGPIAEARIGRALLLRVPLADFGNGDAANHALRTLRDRTLPAAFGHVDGVDYAVAGRTALAYDFTRQLSGRTPLVFGFVLVLAFVLLAVAFRSVAVSLVSIALNLLSIGAACGVVTWVFQDGHGGGLLGFTSYGGIVDWLPVFMFVILFGLSMDYHIFILSRIRERRSGGAGARDAIVGGIGASAGVVTSAAVIMTAAFSVFVVLSAIEYKMMGVGLSVAILIDATIVRGVLLPAALALLGDRAWGRHRPG
ncbi:MMPL family transporter [Actinoallomurus bryophytorum]|uniref:RND superfamily putative drug exporter n=1 Tax=Actinoallomurus bryophytorum TaxID=1490222 RepID=A0A543CR35_9ACTN|nr:MMPL family transporter [Actinoallomurus bryophytorum]TQL99559.1 RND superfamily putative drug exporter [Actinoallomurus bryophytorum]